MTPTNYYKSESFAVNEYKRRLKISTEKAEKRVSDDLYNFKIHIGMPPNCGRRISDKEGRYCYEGKYKAPFLIDMTIEQAI